MLMQLSQILISRPQGHYNSLFVGVRRICEEKAKLAHCLGSFRENRLIAQGEL